MLLGVSLEPCTLRCMKTRRMKKRRRRRRRMKKGQTRARARTKWQKTSHLLDIQAQMKHA